MRNVSWLFFFPVDIALEYLILKYIQHVEDQPK